MFDRHMYSPLLASAPAEGAVAMRPVPRLFAEATSSSVLEPIVKQPAERGRIDTADGIDAAGGRGDGRGDGRGSPPGGGGPRSRRADAELENADEAADSGR